MTARLERTLTSRLAAFGVAVAITLGGLAGPGPAAAAQADDTAYETENGLGITWGTPWEVNQRLTGIDDAVDVDRLVIEDGDQTFIVAEYLDSDIEVETALENDIAFAEDVYTADRIETFEVEDGVGGFWVEYRDDEPWGHLDTVVVGANDHTIAVIVSAPLEEMANAIESVQADIEIEGDAPFAFAGLDDDAVAEIVAEFDDTGVSADADDRTPAEPDEETPESAGDDEETPEIRGGDEYLEDVQDQHDAWSGDLDRLVTILSDEDLSDDAVADEFSALLTTFASAPGEAAELDAPSTYDDIQEAHEAFADGLAEVTDTFVAWLETDPESSAADDAWDEFAGAIDEAFALGDELDEALADAA